MLVALKIENFALIDHLALEFQAGLNVLTGETGAGKSIMLDALDAVLGGRVSQRMIRSGEKRGLIEATFTITDRTRAWLEAHEVPVENDYLVCVRELTAGKKYRAQPLAAQRRQRQQAPDRGSTAASRRNHRPGADLAGRRSANAVALG